MSPQGWHGQGAVLVTWQLGQCQPDVTKLFPKHTQSTVTTLPHLGQDQGAWRDLCFVSCGGLQVSGMGAVCWDKSCRGPGDQLLRNDIMACVFAGVSLLLNTGGVPKVQMWELPVFLRACSVGLTWSRSGFLVNSVTLCLSSSFYLSSWEKKKCLENIYQ